MSETVEEKADLVIDLNFVPAWARKPPEQNPYGRFDGAEGRHQRADRGAGGAERQRSAGRKERPDQRRPAAGGPPGGQGGRRPHGSARPAEQAPAPERPVPLDVEFLPERTGLVPLTRRLALLSRAYSLFELAAQFLSKPEYYAVKVAARAEAGTAGGLSQCTACKALFLDWRRAVAHAFDKHQEGYYRAEETETEPPKGNFVCVARCGLSGELIGPPNYHGYGEALAELHRTRYPHLPLQEYQRRIENVHTPEIIEQWKQKMRKQRVYHTLKTATPLSFTRLADVESHFREHHARELIREGQRFIISGLTSRNLDDPQIRQVIGEAWTRENQFPLRFSVTLRLALRHLGLHIFKTPNGGTFFTAIYPVPIDPTQAIPLIREILEHIAASPGCTIEKLIENVRPGAVLDGPEVGDVRKQVRWLIEKGHVIEFSNGGFAVPVNSVARLQQAKKAGRPPR